MKSRIESASGPIAVRNVRVSVDIADFHGLFKRFSVALSRAGILDRCEYTYTDD